MVSLLFPVTDEPACSGSSESAGGRAGQGRPWTVSRTLIFNTLGPMRWNLAVLMRSPMFQTEPIS